MTQPTSKRLVTEAALATYVTNNAPTPSSASTTAQGIVELATNTEATTGTDTSRAVTPAGVKAVTDALAFVPAAAVAVVSGTNQTAIDAAFAKVTTNGGLVIFPPGDYTGTINITANKRIDVLAFGARILAQADNVNLVRINQGVGDTIAGASVRGFRLEGNGHAGVVGVAFEDTDGSLVGDLFIKGTAVGVLHHAAGSGKWVEGCTVDNIFTTNCGIGVEYRKEAAANPSFNECVLRDVRLSQSTSIGIKQGTGADFTRVTWDNTTVWCPNGAVGVEFGGRLDFARLQFGIESLGSGVGSTGIHITSTYTNYSDPYAHTVEASLVGSFATRILDESTGGFGVVLRDGSNFVSTNYGPIITAKHSGDTDFRLRVGPTGKYEIGDGTSSPFALLDLWYAQYVKASGNVLFQGDPGFPNANANGGSASKAIHVYGTADTYAGYVPVYATSDGPAVVPSNTQTGTTYTLVAADAGKAVTCNNAAAITLTVPPNSSVPYTIGTVISVEQLGAGQVTITPGAGVTINSRGALTKTAGQYGAASLRKIGTDTWLLAGDLA